MPHLPEFEKYSIIKKKDKNMSNFTPQDIEQIEKHGLNLDTVMRQLADFASGFPYADIISPATLSHGIMDADSQIDKYREIYHKNKDNYKIVKFVPASGAATRMFKDLFEFLSSGTMNATTQTVLDNIEKFAFYDDLKQYLPENPTDHDIIECLVTERGLNYGALPKALLKFHKYKGENRTALAEHLTEGAQYATCNNTVNIHFTVSPEHIAGFKELISQLVPEYEQRLGIAYNISMSTQKPQTDTIAVKLDNTPFRNPDNTLLFRPAGHGALIENLNDLDADIVFIKNIDNVCPDSARSDTIIYKETLAGILIETQQQIFNMLSQIENSPTPQQLDEIKSFISNTLNIDLSTDSSIDTIREVLNRPIRVCGMIKNTGAPGGGPFIVRASNGSTSLQIVEPGQIAPEQQHILKNGEYFSPADLVCGVRDWRGEKFDLTKYIDHETGFISEKSKNGMPLRAMERPGLWNGAMAKWNTIFVKIIGTTFTPAKVVTDLIKDEHTEK